MGTILIVGCGVDAQYVARAVDQLGELGHDVEVVTGPAKAAEIQQAARADRDGRVISEDLKRLVEKMHEVLSDSEWDRERDGLGIQVANFHEEKPLQRRYGPVYGSARSRAGRAARWS